jgi:putative FmdB family regulatory protein
LPIYEFKCDKCGAVSSFLEKFDEWHWRGRKCAKCGSRKTRKILSKFSSSVERTTTETMNELKQMGNVQFVPRSTPPWGEGPPPGGCPYENAEKEAAAKAGPQEGPGGKPSGG